MRERKSSEANRKSNSNQIDRPLPSGWVWATVGQIAESYKNGIYKPKEFYADDGVACLRMYNIEDGHLVWQDVKRMKLSTQEVSEYALLPGDILVNRVNSRELVGKACVIPGGTEQCVFESKNIRLRVHRTAIDPRYLNYRLLLAGRHHFWANAQQVVGMASISQGQLGSFELPIAPLNEQRRIVAKIEELFSDLDAGVAALERAKANLKRYRAAVLKAALDGSMTADWRAKHSDVEPASKLLERILIERRRKWEADQLAKFKAAGKEPPKSWKAKYVEPSPPDTANLPELPEGWCWTKLDAVADVVGGITKDQKRAKLSGMRDVPYLRVANVQRGFLELSEMKKITASEEVIADLLLEVDDVLFTEGGDRDKLGRGWVWSGELPECIHQNHIFRARLFSKELQPRLISHHANSFGQEWFVKAGKQTTNLASINLGILRQFPVPVASSEEQKEINSRIDERLSEIEAAGVGIDHGLLRAIRLRQSILKQAFEGKLVPQDPKDEPASVLLDRIKGDSEPHEANGHPAKTKPRKAKQKTS